MTEPAADHEAAPTRGRSVAAALGRSAAFAGLYFVIALAIVGAEITTALWQSLFCFGAVAVLMLVGLSLRGARRPTSEE